MRSRRNLKLLGLLLLGALGAPFLVPVRCPEDTVPAGQLADPTSLFTTVGGVRLHYKTAGKGEPVLLLMHGLGSSLFTWRWAMPALAARSMVVAFDRPGFGLTSRPMPGEWRGEGPYSPGSQVELAMGLLDRLGVERAMLVGHSAGGRIAALAALRHPERVQALVLVDPAIYLDSLMYVLRPLASTPQMRRLGPMVARYLMESRGEEAIRVAWHDQSRVTPELLAGYMKPLRADDWDRGLWEVTAADRPTDLTRQLPKLRLPTLLITGQYDRLVPPLLTKRVAREIPDARLVTIPDCGHVPQEERPEQFLEAINGFLTELSREAAAKR